MKLCAFLSVLALLSNGISGKFEGPPVDPDTVGVYVWQGCPNVRSDPPPPNNAHHRGKRLQERIAGRKLYSKVGEFGMPVRLWFTAEETLAVCGGSIVSERHILSSATCLVRPKDKKEFKIKEMRMGGHASLRDAVVRRDTDLEAISYQDYIMRYEPSIAFPDFLVAILKTSSRLLLNVKQLEASCLFLGDPRYLDTQWLKILGYGADLLHEKAPLMHAWIKTIPSFKMDKYLAAFNFAKASFRDVLEASFFLNQTLSGFCGGERGSPVLMPMNIGGKKRWVNVGQAGFLRSHSQTWCVGSSENEDGLNLPSVVHCNVMNAWRKMRPNIPWFNSFLWIESQIGKKAEIVKGTVHPLDTGSHPWQWVYYQFHKFSSVKVPPMDYLTIVKFPASGQDSIDQQCPKISTFIPTKKATRPLFSRMEGGNKAEQHEFPFIVKLITENIYVTPSYLQHCAGSILTDRHILSHVYCIRLDISKLPPDSENENRETPEEKVIWYKLKTLAAGGSDLRNTDVQFRYKNSFYSVLFNEKWEGFGEWPFFAVFTLKASQKLVITKDIVEPTCLFIGDIRVLDRRDVLMQGWGTSSQYEPGTEAYIKRIWQRMIGNEQFRRTIYLNWWGNYTDFLNNTEGQFGLNQVTGGICAGDWGSPIMIPMRPRGAYGPIQWVQISVADSLLTVGQKCTGYVESLMFGQKAILPIMGVHHSFNYWKRSFAVSHNAFLWMQSAVGIGADTLYGGPNPANVEFFQWEDYPYSRRIGELPRYPLKRPKK